MEKKDVIEDIKALEDAVEKDNYYKIDEMLQTVIIDVTDLLMNLKSEKKEEEVR